MVNAMNYSDSSYVYPHISIDVDEDDFLCLYCINCKHSDEYADVSFFPQGYADILVEIFAKEHQFCHKGTEYDVRGVIKVNYTDSKLYCTQCKGTVKKIEKCSIKFWAPNIPLALLCEKCSKKTEASPIRKYIYYDVFWILICDDFFVSSLAQFELISPYYRQMYKTRIMQPQGKAYFSSLDNVILGLKDDYKQTNN